MGNCFVEVFVEVGIIKVIIIEVLGIVFVLYVV